MCPGEAAKEEGRMFLFSKQKYFHRGWEKRKVGAEKNRESSLLGGKHLTEI